LRLAFVILGVSVIHFTALFLWNVVAAPSLFLRYSLGFVITVLYPVFFMAGTLKERVLFGSVCSALHIFVMMFVLVIVPHGRPSVAYSYFEDDDPWQMMLRVLALFLFLYAALLLFLAHVNTEGKRYIPRKYWTAALFLFTVICTGLIATVFFGEQIGDSERIRVFLTIASLGLFIVWLLSYFVFFFICRYFSKTAEANALAMQNDMIERYMLRKLASDERIKILSHDLKHSLTQWRALAEEKGDANALGAILEYEGQLRSSLLINVENENANAVINQKQWEAAQGRVEFLVDGVFHKDLALSKLDLCSLLGNLLDNAIEAAALAETPALRRVKLSLRRKGSLLIVVVENGYALEPVLEEGAFISRKKDSGLHAIGMRSIRYVAEKYDGIVNNSYENNWFKASVMLRGYEAAPSSIK
jgi:hypothetical protein